MWSYNFVPRIESIRRCPNWPAFGQEPKILEAGSEPRPAGHARNEVAAVDEGLLLLDPIQWTVWTIDCVVPAGVVGVMTVHCGWPAGWTLGAGARTAARSAARSGNVWLTKTARRRGCLSSVPMRSPRLTEPGPGLPRASCAGRVLREHHAPDRRDGGRGQDHADDGPGRGPTGACDHGGHASRRDRHELREPAAVAVLVSSGMRFGNATRTIALARAGDEAVIAPAVNAESTAPTIENANANP